MTISNAASQPTSTMQRNVASGPGAAHPANATPRGRGAFAGLLAAAMAARPQVPAPLRAAPERPILSQPPAAPHARVEAKTHRHERDGEPERDAKHARAPIDPLDPAMRNPALVAPAVAASPTTAVQAVEAPRAKMSIEELLPALVRRIAWAGDKHKGTVRLELGAGAHAGTTLLVHADGGRLRIEVHGAEGRELDDFRRRLDSRLRGHGLDVESVT